MPRAGLPRAGLPYAGLPYAGLPYAGLPYAGPVPAGLPADRWQADHEKTEIWLLTHMRIGAYFAALVLKRLAHGAGGRAMPTRSRLALATATTLLAFPLLALPAQAAGGAAGAGQPGPVVSPPGQAARLVSRLAQQGAAGKAAAPAPQSAGTALVGVFSIDSGQCSSGTPTGSYFRMIQPGGNASSGPFISNGSSHCSDQTYTPLAAGTTGLSTEAFEPFAASPGSSDSIVAPATFFGSSFAVATQNPDKQTGATVPVPSISATSSGTLTGQTEAFQAYYNGAYYNQGAPKPGGSSPGITSSSVSGTYNSATGAYTLNWVSTIEGGSFNGFSGDWHLTGTFHPGSSSSAGSTSSSGGGTTTSSGTTSSGTTSSGTTSSGATSSAQLPFTGPDIPFGVAGVLAALGLTRLALSRRMRSRPHLG